MDLKPMKLYSGIYITLFASLITLSIFVEASIYEFPQVSFSVFFTCRKNILNKVSVNKALF